MTDLPSLRETLDAHGLLAKKSFGQHFLLDLNVTRKIVRYAGPFDGRAVIEVGPGPGGLTRAILESDAGKVVLVEKDPRFIPLLSELDDGSGRLTIVEGDALNVREAQLTEGPTHLVSNLPYNVGTPLLIKWLTGPWQPCALTLMFQKEVAERIVAAPGDDAYGRLAVITQAVAEARIVMHLPAAAFTPPPKVASAVVHVVPLADRPSPERLKKLERVTAAAFGQRRKMLRSSLKQLGGGDLCEAAGIEPDARAEVIDIAGFLRLADALK
ncbi:16S rRNA (adenine(1518)-N(6)/adenine(1519)-N(6))-dimethyltransferase RsmA [Brevundimonas bullata]|uniref:16S rRNA (adenine(1518)-N(6)/adenine(1519)-N(6))- dimethyltransferase RsmA n=1 Tax=Brevundimonas bullata TaxID=13160 RepID=UPI000E0A9904|nr:16S rRNA (adenine(1518)-N(6)/adenine(1519)-N(6))-dimethyltransferase RsmA [Brevundimonas bullata]WQE35379.1 16S rRNA (adenine(1518)-N(6)/adenine(1519)-N(6))-dimethyltransferase RsmA [Brevundimonas bullata]